MAREVVARVTVRLVMDVKDGVAPDNVINNLDYGFVFDGDEAVVRDTEIVDWQLTRDDAITRGTS